MADWEVQSLSRLHRREHFSCGNPALDQFLKTLASQYEKKNIGRTHVGVERNQTQVMGFYTAASGSIAVQTLPRSLRKRLPEHPIPTAHLGRLAVDRACQGQGLGETLLFHFFGEALKSSRTIGMFGMDVFATDATARAFYERYGFVDLQDSPLHLFIALATAEQFVSDR